MNTPLQIVLEQARTVPASELPRLLGDLREVECTALARLSAPAPAAAAPDTLLTVAEASTALHCSKDYLYKTSLPFKRKLGRKLLFSRAGIAEYLRKQGR
jgi:hypothetical protein